MKLKRCGNPKNKTEIKIDAFFPLACVDNLAKLTFCVPTHITLKTIYVMMEQRLLIEAQRAYVEKEIHCILTARPNRSTKSLTASLS